MIIEYMYNQLWDHVACCIFLGLEILVSLGVTNGTPVRTWKIFNLGYGVS